MTVLDGVYLERGVAGLKPGKPFHFGNYFGALRKVIDSQERTPGESFLIIADLHATLNREGVEVSRHEIRRLVSECIYLGVDPAKTVIFVQSDIPELLLLMWVIACISPFLKHFDHVAQSPKCLFYDTLMAADVLGLRASTVNVGRDLHNSVRYCSRLAEAMNKHLDRAVFPQICRAAGPAEYDDVPGIDGRRMSVTASNHIPILPNAVEEIAEAVERIDCPGEPRGRSGSTAPLECLSVRLASLVAPPDASATTFRDFDMGRLNASQLKDLMKGWICQSFAEARNKRQNAPLAPSAIDEILESGRIRARKEYRETLLEVGK